MNHFTKILALFLLLAGWCLVLGAVVLLLEQGRLAGFALAGLSVEFLGLAMLFRAHRFTEWDRQGRISG